jgi:4-amino-4-deoxy-L-arabinose transferase-like glycosyltransferase
MRPIGIDARESEAPPPALLSWIPYLWSRVLFPGKATASSGSPRLALLVLLAVPGILLYPCLSFHLFEPDEGRYAEIAREMLARGEWVVPLLQGEPYLDKPPLLYWLTIISFRLFGAHDWSARLAPALAVHGCVLVVYLLGRRTLGERPAFWGALILALAPGFIGMGRLLLLDGLLSLFVTLSLLGAFEALRVRAGLIPADLPDGGDKPRRSSKPVWGWWLLSAAACGLGVLTKGPIAVVLLVPPLLTQRWLTSRLCRVGWEHLIAFAAVLLGVVLPWYVAVYVREPIFFRYFFWQHNVQRFLTPFNHLEPIWYYAPIVLGGLLPGTLLLPSFLRYLLSGRSDNAERRCPELGLMLLAGGWCLLFFTLSGSKLPTYILPAFPPLALALGYFVSSSAWSKSRWPAVVACAMFGVLCVGNYVLVPWYARYRSPVNRFDEVARFCGDPGTPVICYPRNCDSVSFYVGRDDVRCYRSNEIEVLRQVLRDQPRTVVLCTHRHSLRGLREALPPELMLTRETHFGLGETSGMPEWLDRRLEHLFGETALGLADATVVEHRK